MVHIMTAPKINLKAELATRLGLGADVEQALLLEHLDRALADAQHPEGTVLIDETALAELRTQAELGRTGRERGIVELAIRQGRVPPSSRESWVQLLMHDSNAEQVLSSLKPNTIPLRTIGYGKDDELTSDEALLRQLFPDTNT
jgi:hypothetical protein